MFLSENYGGNLHCVLPRLNNLGVSLYVHSLHYTSADITVVVFKFEDYPGYVRYCEKTNRDTQPPEEFFKGKV